MTYLSIKCSKETKCFAASVGMAAKGLIYWGKIHLLIEDGCFWGWCPDLASTSLFPKPFSFDLAETAVLRGALQTQREPPTCHWRLKTVEAFPGFCLFQQPQRYLGLWVWGGVEEREASNLAAVERRSSPETLPHLSSSQGWQQAKAERTACPAQGACLVRALHGCRQGAGRCGWPHSQRRAESSLTRFVI